MLKSKASDIPTHSSSNSKEVAKNAQNAPNMSLVSTNADLAQSKIADVCLEVAEDVKDSGPVYEVSNQDNSAAIDTI